MKLQYLFIALLFGFSFSNCVTVPGDPSGNGDPDINPWKLVDDLVSEQLILNAKATADNLHVISEGEYFILDKDKKISNNTPFTKNPKCFGIPAFTSNTFVRLAGDGINRRVLEFRPTKTPTESWPIKEEDLAESPDEQLEVDEFLAGEIGAFNTDGTKFLLATISRPKFEYKFILFDVRMEPSTFHIEEVTIFDYITIKDINVDNGAISSIKYIGGDFYVATRNGAFRIDKDGRVQRVSPYWTIDFFRGGSELYATAFNNGEMYVSEDNGKNWDRSNIISELELVKVRGGRLVSQFQIGHEFETPADTDNIFEVKSMKINPTLEGNPGLYRAFEFFNGEYYFSVGKELYFASDVMAVE